SCTKDEAAVGIDLELLNMAEETAGFVWFKNSDEWLPKSSGSGHNYSGLRTRYNATAATQLDTEGKIRGNAAFPEGSLIVKELSNGTTVERYSILWKQSDNANADSNGWVWGYINADGSVATTAEDQGAICTGCHLQSDNIDYMLMNKFFP
ncbi:MAG: cytochrome P460 family protein, partial [Flavobacteriales bacterium]